MMYAKKPKKGGHDCRRRKAGQPKLGSGLCYAYGLRPAVVERIAGRRDAAAWLAAVRAGLDPDDLDL